MQTIVNILASAFDLLLVPFRSLPPLVGLTFISLVTGIIMLIIYKLVSNQQGITAAKDKIKAYLLEVVLFRDDLGVFLRTQKNILLANLRYLKYAIVPLLVIIIPVIFIIIQLNFWYGYRPLKVGEKTILKVYFEDKASLMSPDVKVILPDGLSQASKPLRIKSELEMDMLIEVTKPGSHEIIVKYEEQGFNKRLYAGDSLKRLTPRRHSPSFWEAILYPGEPPLPSDKPIKAIAISYPSTLVSFFGYSIHWIIIYFALSIIFGFGLKGVFKVDI